MNFVFFKRACKLEWGGGGARPKSESKQHGYEISTVNIHQ